MTKPAVNADVHAIADRAKHDYAVGTLILASTQYWIAELAGRGVIDPKESKDLQYSLVRIWEALYSGTVCAVRDWDTDDITWDEAANTYSDGRRVRNQASVEPRAAADSRWEHRRFLLGEGAVREHPRGTIAVISPVDPSARNQSIGPVGDYVTDQPRANDLAALRSRLGVDIPASTKSPYEKEDEKVYVWTLAKRAERTVAWGLVDLVRQGRDLSREVAREFSSHLMELLQLLNDATVGPLWPDADQETYDERCLVYSDGTPAARWEQIPGSEAAPILDEELTEGDIGQHGTPPSGWRIAVDLPPHRRGHEREPRT